MERAAELQNPEVQAELNRRVRECKRKCFASGRLGSIPQASARASQQATREQVKGQWCESSTGQCVGDATGRGDPAGGYAGVPTVFLWHTCVSRGSSTREQEDPEVRGGVGIADQSSSIVSFHGPRHPATPIPRQLFKRDHNTSRKLVNPLIEPLRIPSLKHRCHGKVGYRSHRSP
jgi:hypothetical protein